MAWAQFCRDWGPAMYLNPAWSTRDHIIPWALYRLCTDPELVHAAFAPEL